VIAVGGEPGQELPLEDLERMLHTYAGAPLPASRAARSKRSKWVALVAGVGICAAGVGIALLATSGGDGRSAAARCPRVLIFRGTGYTPKTLRAPHDLRLGRMIGSAQVPRCGGRPRETIEVVQIRRVDPRVAVAGAGAGAGAGQTVYVAARACRELGLEDDPARCLEVILSGR
jgi:hypothetical protein